MAVFDVFDPLQNITPKFTEEQLEVIIEWFDSNAKPLLVINDGEPINVISIEQIIDFLKLKKFHRRSFHYPTYGEIMTEADNLKAGQLRIVTKEQFIYMLNQWVLETTLKHELMLAIKIFDTEKRDFLDIEEIQSIVTSYGDVFNDDEVREMLRDADVRGDGNVVYEEFIDSIFSVAPQLNNIMIDYLYENPDEDPSVPPEPVEEEPPPPPPAPPPPPPPPPPKDKKKKK
ncbi:troponin C [Amyelois transitella]|uniref:troponin C n=1 Tax=Amyelois transitella TaxID=680683 RepID=UPI00067BE0F6|nr:troponin C [Amyelois transitella]